VRSGKYKLLVLPEGTYLFDLESDISEAYNLAEQMPEKVVLLKQKMQQLNLELSNERRAVGHI